MSVIEKMSITGIRSFSPDDRQVIEFFKPLTLILGPNGCGKTTLIECLRYITTGDMPPNSDRGGSFVHDPKFVGEREVKAQVKLQFKDVLGKKVIVTRSLQVTQALKKLTFKTLEGTITRYTATGEKSALSSKCADIDTEMIGFLGVSKAILNYVIFCHQEESSWPLSEGRALKQKFDDIFAATRYIKALEEIRKKQKDMKSDIKVFESQVEALVSNKRKAEEFKRELESNESRLSACRDSIQSLEDKLKPINEKLIEIKAKQDKIGNLQGQLDKSLELIKKYEEDEKNLRNSIGENIFNGTKEDLQEEMENFQSFVLQTKRKLDKLQQEMASLQRKYQTDQKNKVQLVEELGKFKAEHERHKQDVCARDSMLRDLRKSLGLGDVDEDEPLEDSQVASIMRNLQQRNAASQNEYRECRVKHDAIDNRLQNSIQSICMEKAQKQSKMNSDNAQINKNKLTIRNINDELNRLDSSANRQDDIEKELQDCEEDLEKVESSVNLDDLRQEVTSKQQKKDEIEEKLTALNQEMTVLQKESKTRHEIELVNKDIKAKQEAMEKVLNRHRETVIHILGEMPERGIYDKLSSTVNDLSQKVNKYNKDMEKERSNLSSLQTTKKFHSNQLASKRETLSAHQNKIAEVCGSQNFDISCDNLRSNIKELQDEKGALSGSLFLFNKYISKLQKPRPCCPLCARAFPERDEAEELVQKLRSKLQAVPDRVADKTRLIREKEERLDKLMAMRPLREAITSLIEKEIPELESKEETVTEEIAKSTSKINEIDEILDNLMCDKNAASNILPELMVVDKTQADITQLGRRLTSLKAQIGGKDTSRTIQTVTEEQKQFQSQLKSLSAEVEDRRQRINSHLERVHALKGRANELRSELNQLCSDQQKRSGLVKQGEDLAAENAVLLEETKKIKEELSVYEVKVKALVKEKEAATKAKEEELEKLRNKIREEEKETDRIHKISQDIDRYTSADKESALERHEQKVSQLTADINSKRDELNRQAATERELTQNINSQELKFRTLEDNLRLIEIVETIGRMSTECRKLKEKIGNSDARLLHNELQALLREERAVSRERDEASGRESVLKEKIREFRKQLQDDMFRDAEGRHSAKCIQLRTTELACDDLTKYYTALNKAIMNYHQIKMKEINKIIKDLWIRTYAGNDIDYIAIQSDEDSGIEKAKRTFNYRVVMFKGDTPTDMRGRCSAGQKVLASLIIRLALAETFCLNCGILALDEPTTNLDRENISKLARALVDIVQSRSEQRNFQLIIITHDEDFIELLGRSDVVDYFYKVSKDNEAHSRISKLYISDMA